MILIVPEVIFFRCLAHNKLHTAAALQCAAAAGKIVVGWTVDINRQTFAAGSEFNGFFDRKRRPVMLPERYPARDIAQIDHRNTAADFFRSDSVNFLQLQTFELPVDQVALEADFQSFAVG